MQGLKEAVEYNEGKINARSDDVFYSEENMKRLEKAINDIKGGKAKLTEHELVEEDIL